MGAHLEIAAKTKPVKNVRALTLQLLGLRWIPIDVCPPPQHMDFLGLTIRDKGDYHVGHCVFDGSGNEGLEKLTHWFPCPALPKRAVDGFPPHALDLGKKLTASLQQWLRQADDA